MKAHRLQALYLISVLLLGSALFAAICCSGKWSDDDNSDFWADETEKIVALDWAYRPVTCPVGEALVINGGTADKWEYDGRGETGLKLCFSDDLLQVIQTPYLPESISFIGHLLSDDEGNVPFNVMIQGANHDRKHLDLFHLLLSKEGVPVMLHVKGFVFKDPAEISYNTENGCFKFHFTEENVDLEVDFSSTSDWTMVAPDGIFSEWEVDDQRRNIIAECDNTLRVIAGVAELSHFDTLGEYASLEALIDKKFYNPGITCQTQYVEGKYSFQIIYTKRKFIVFAIPITAMLQCLITTLDHSQFDALRMNRPFSSLMETNLNYSIR